MVNRVKNKQANLRLTEIQKKDNKIISDGEGIYRQSTQDFKGATYICLEGDGRGLAYFSIVYMR